MQKSLLTRGRGREGVKISIAIRGLRPGTGTPSGGQSAFNALPWGFMGTSETGHGSWKRSRSAPLLASLTLPHSLTPSLASGNKMRSSRRSTQRTRKSPGFNDGAQSGQLGKRRRRGGERKGKKNFKKKFNYFVAFLVSPPSIVAKEMWVIQGVSGNKGWCIAPLPLLSCCGHVQTPPTIWVRWIGSRLGS